MGFRMNWRGNETRLLPNQIFHLLKKQFGKIPDFFDPYGKSNFSFIPKLINTVSILVV